jgi:hypothetical protein
MWNLISSEKGRKEKGWVHMKGLRGSKSITAQSER